MRRQRFMLGSALAVLVLVVTSCARYEFDVHVNANGSGQFDILFTVPPGADQPLLAGDAPETAQQFVGDDGWHGWSMSIPFSEAADIELIRAALNDDQQALHDFTVEELDGGGWRYRHTLPAFTRLDVSALEIGTPDDTVGHYIIRVTLPGQPVNHNADRVEQGAFVWEIDVANDQPQRLSAETDGTGATRTDATATTGTDSDSTTADDEAVGVSGFNFGLYGTLIVVIVAIGIGVAFFVIRRREAAIPED